jgi:hypothetical protein
MWVIIIGNAWLIILRYCPLIMIGNAWLIILRYCPLIMIGNAWLIILRYCPLIMIEELCEEDQSRFINDGGLWEETKLAIVFDF